MRRLLAVFLVVFPGIAFGQAGTPPPKVIDIDTAEVVPGSVAGPDIGAVVGTLPAKHTSLLRERTNFNDKVVASVSEL